MVKFKLPTTYATVTTLSVALEGSDAISSIAGDSESMKKCSSERDDIDMAYNVLSDILFFFGSICYLTVAYWRASPASSFSNNNYLRYWACRTVVIAGPILYIWNAAVEIAWAVHNMRRHRGESQRRRGEATWDLCSNLFFGCAAIVDLISAILIINSTIVSTFPTLDDWNAFSIILYFISGLIYVFGFNLSYSTLLQSFVSTGDVLFLIGSISDLILVIYSRKSSSSGDIVDSYWLISASLWFVNAMLYLIADLLAHLGKRRSKCFSSKNGHSKNSFHQSFHTVDSMTSLNLVEELT